MKEKTDLSRIGSFGLTAGLLLLVGLNLWWELLAFCVGAYLGGAVYYKKD